MDFCRFRSTVRIPESNLIFSGANKNVNVNVNFDAVFNKTIIPLALVGYKIGTTRFVGYLPSQIQRAFVGLLLKPWLLALLPTAHVLDTLEIFRLEIGQIGFNRVKKAFTTWQPAFLATSIAFCNILARACAEINILNEKVTYVFRLFDFLNSFFAFPFFLFFSFCCSYWPSTGLACS